MTDDGRVSLREPVKLNENELRLLLQRGGNDWMGEKAAARLIFVEAELQRLRESVEHLVSNIRRVLDAATRLSNAANAVVNRLPGDGNRATGALELLLSDLALSPNRLVDLADAAILGINGSDVQRERDEARNIATQLHKIHSRCLNKKTVHDYIRFDDDSAVIRSWPAPPRADETEDK